MNYSVYGKKMENLRKRVNVRLVRDARNVKKWVTRLTFVSQKILVAIHDIKPVLTHNKQTYARFTILYLSKCVICVIFITII